VDALLFVNIVSHALEIVKRNLLYLQKEVA